MDDIIKERKGIKSYAVNKRIYGLSIQEIREKNELIIAINEILEFILDFNPQNEHDHIVRFIMSGYVEQFLIRFEYLTT